jgi:hypothetical protein
MSGKSSFISLMPTFFHNVMKKLVFLLAGLLCGTHALADESVWRWTYDGSFEDGRVFRMTLAVEGSDVSGTYCFQDGLTPVPVQGTMDSENNLNLTAVDGQRTPVAIFTGNFIALKPGGNCSFNEEIGGTFQSLDGGFSRRFSLSLSHGVDQAKGSGRYSENPADDATVEQNVRLLLSAIRADDKTAVARLADFPLTVNGLSQKPKELRASAEFLNLYDRIFTARFKTAVLATIPHDLFVNTQGIMLGGGEIWLTHQGQISVLNSRP